MSAVSRPGGFSSAGRELLPGVRYRRARAAGARPPPDAPLQQAAILAREIARDVGTCATSPWLLERTRVDHEPDRAVARRTPTQRGGGFCRPQAPCRVAVRGRRVLLIDDVITTGSTVATVPAP